MTNHTDECRHLGHADLICWGECTAPVYANSDIENMVKDALEARTEGDFEFDVSGPFIVANQLDEIGAEIASYEIRLDIRRRVNTR